MKTGNKDEAYTTMKKIFSQNKPRAGGIENNKDNIT